jgi:tripartite-type tricarboxylate transporter receptor subunit TctC
VAFKFIRPWVEVLFARMTTAYKLKHILLGALAVIVANALFAPAGITAENNFADYPKKPVTYIVPFGDGGESSIVARLQQPVFKKLTGRDLVVLNKPGGGGALIWSQLNTMPTDGYTIVGVNLPHIILQPTQGAGYKTDDITVVHIFHYTPDAIVVAADSPFETLQNLIDAAVQQPGKLQVSGSGRASANQLAQISFDRITGGKTSYRSYKGTAASIAALLQGRADAAMAYTTVAKKYGDKVRLLAVAMEKRHTEFPDVPTFRELDIDMVDGAYRGVAVPKGTPVSARKAISALFARIGEDPAFKKIKTDMGFAPLNIGYDILPSFMAKQSKDALSTANRAGLID